MSVTFDVLDITFDTDFGRFREVRRERGWVVLEHEWYGKFAARLDDKGLLNSDDTNAIMHHVSIIYRMDGYPMPDIPA